MTKDPESGVVLFNVLVIVAFMTLIVMAMVTMGDLAITRSQRFSEAGQATLYVTAGEQTALAALLRDITDAPDTDNLKEPWAKIAQDRVEIEGGYFALGIEDMQGYYNLANLRPSKELGAAPPDSRLLTILISNLDLPADLAGRISERMAQDPPITSLADLTAEQVTTNDEADALTKVVTVLPLKTEINLNTAPLPVLIALTGNPPEARLLEGLRTRKGLLTAADLSAAHVVPDSRSGFTSAFFRVSVTVTVGQTEQAFSSLIYRNAKAEDGVALRIILRVRTIVPFPAGIPLDDQAATAAQQPTGRATDSKP